MNLRANGAGRVQLSLARRARVIARAGLRLEQGGTVAYRLRLPRRTKAGNYTLKATYSPSAGRAITASRRIVLTAKQRARSARASSVPGVVVGHGPRGLPDGRFHGDRPARTFRVR